MVESRDHEGEGGASSSGDDGADGHPVDPAAASHSDGADNEAVEVTGVDFFTAERIPDYNIEDQAYITDLLNGLLETGADRCFIRRGAPLPFFGFITQRPSRCTFDGILHYVGHIIKVPEDELAWGAEGVLRAAAGGDDDLFQILFGVEVGPRKAWLRFTRQVEQRVLEDWSKRRKG